MATNTLTAYPPTSLVAGMNTALYAPAGTSYVIDTMTVAMNRSTGTAGTVTAVVLFGLTGGTLFTWHPVTAISANEGIQYQGAFTLPPGYGVFISAQTGNGLDVVIAGLKVV